MRHRHAVLTVVLILTLVVSVAGCKKKAPETEPVPPVEVAEPPPPPPPPPQVDDVEDDFPPEPFIEEKPDIDTLITDWNRSGVLQTVYFAYDSTDLDDSTRRTLRNNADWLKAHQDVNVLVEGNCDERGTIEYNLSLGQRRADAVRSYLTSLGVSRERARIITYGEERPIDPGHSETAWSKNRRAAFVVESQR